MSTILKTKRSWLHLETLALAVKIDANTLDLHITEPDKNGDPMALRVRDTLARELIAALDAVAILIPAHGKEDDEGCPYCGVKLLESHLPGCPYIA